jgi:flagellar biosynthesis GTPase FlhF
MPQIQQARHNAYLRTRRGPEWIPGPPPWLFRLSYPPPRLHADDWPLIEHIRTTGQLASGSLIGNSSYLLTEGQASLLDPPGPDLNARERLAALKAREARERAEEEREERRQQERRERRKAAERLAQMRKDKAEQAAAERAAARAEHAAHIELERIASTKRYAEQLAAEQLARTELKRVVAQHSEYQDVLTDAQKLAHGRWLTRTKNIMNHLQQAGVTRIRADDLMKAVGCDDAREMALCVNELGLNWHAVYS